MPDQLTQICLTTCLLMVIVLIFLLVFSFRSLEITEYGLDYSYISKTVNDQAYMGGIYFLGVGHSFIKYPSTFQTIEFSHERSSQSQSIQSRTQDGLEVDIEISFQYKLKQEQLYDLYMTYYTNFEKIFEKHAIDILTEAATYYTAYEFFMNRTQIGNDMQKHLNDVFEKKLYSTIEFFQLRKVDLPEKFEQSIQQSEVKKQDINKAQAEKNKTIVELKTQLMSADYQRQVVINLAKGDAKAIIAQAKADADSYQQVQNMMTQAYVSLKKNVGLDNKEMMDYIKAKAIKDYRGDNLVIGFNKVEELPK